MKNPFRGLRFSLLDFHNARANVGMKIAFAAICCIPLIYGGLYLAAFYDPYGNIDKVPVVVVNEDRGWQMDGDTLEAGASVVDQLRDADALDFSYEDNEAVAREGLEAGTYYMELVIPEDFSECVASASTDSPKQAHFELIANQSANSIATTMGLSAFRVITSKVNYAIGEDYYVNIFDMIDDSTASIKVAADGSSELADGLESAESGSRRISDGLANADSGAGKLAQGLVEASAGSQTLTAGIGTAQSGAATLDAGLGQLQSQGTSQVASGAAALQAQLDGQAAQIHQLSSGASQVSDGVDQVVGTMSGLSTTVASAGTQLADIQSQLDGINAAATDIEPQAGKLTSHAQALAGDLTNLQTTLGGMSTTLEGVGGNLSTAGDDIKAATTALDGIDQSTLTDAQKTAIQTAIDNLGSAGRELTTAGTTLAGVRTAAGSIDATAVTTDANAVAGDLQTIGSSMGGLTVQAQGVIDDSTSLMNGVAGTMAQLQSPQTQAQLAALQAGASMVANGTATLDANLTTDVYDAGGNPQTLHAGIAALSAGAATVDANLATAEQGASQLASGLGQLQNGSATLSTGLGSARTGAEALASGLGLLYDGSNTLTTGLVSASDGAQQLAEGLGDGYETASEATRGATERSAMMSEPVSLDQEEYTTVTNYGSGFAPYFIALGLWVGAMMCTFLIKPLNQRLVASGAAPVTAAFAGLVPSLLVGVIQAVLMAATLQFGLNIDLLHPLAYYLLCILTACCFAAWNQMLVASLGFPGKFLSVVLLMLQLTSAAGTFPLEVVPGFFQTINPLLPMTYAVRALRVATTGVDLASIAPDALALVAFGLVPFAITCLVAARKRIVTLSDLHPLVQL